MTIRRIRHAEKSGGHGRSGRRNSGPGFFWDEYFTWYLVHSKYLELIVMVWEYIGYGEGEGGVGRKGERTLIVKKTKKEMKKERANCRAVSAFLPTSDLTYCQLSRWNRTLVAPSLSSSVHRLRHVLPCLVLPYLVFSRCCRSELFAP